MLYLHVLSAVLGMDYSVLLHKILAQTSSYIGRMKK